MAFQAALSFQKTEPLPGKTMSLKFFTFDDDFEVVLSDF
jgi:hypothetical protein